MLSFHVLTRITTLLAALALALPAAAQDMRGPFKHAPRSVRTRTIDQQHIRLDLDFDFQKQQIDGRATLTFTPFKPLRSITLDAADMKILAVRLVEGKPAEKGQLPALDADAIKAARELKFTTRSDDLNITLDREARPGQVLHLVIDYRISEPEHGAHFVVPDEREPDQAPMVWTQSETEFARYWYPCIDTPSDRLTSEIVATVPASYTVLSNGKLKSNEPAQQDGRRTWHWVQRKSHVPYLLSIVAGEFDEFKQNVDGIEVSSYVPKGRLAEAARSFEKTPAMIRHFGRLVDYRYPWAKYSQICVDEYMWGGMEHTSATTLNVRTLHDERAHLDVSSDNLVAHELAHQWFGDLMTCKDWAEIWLNESFATYFATLWAEEDRGADEAAWDRWKEAESYFGEDKNRYRRPIVTYRYDNSMNMFDRHSYPKGARVLHMLRFVLGDERFFKALSHYVHQNQFSTVETADLRIACEQATGEGLNWFFDQWIYHGGHPEYQASYDWDEASKTVRLTIRQTQKVDALTPLFRMPIEIELVTGSTSQRRRVTVSKAEETFHFQLDERPRRVVFDPQDWVLKKLTFDKPKEEWLDQLAHDRHIIARVRAVDALAGHTKDEEVRAALIRAARTDGFWAVRQRAAKVLGTFSGDAVREALIQVAREDDKSFVRREALESLANFSHADTRAALRKVFADDRSYYAAAEALKALAKIERDACREELLAALKRDSHGQTIAKAACDALAEMEDKSAVPLLLEVVTTSPDPQRRSATLEALARLGGQDKQVLKALERELGDARYDVRQAAVKALGKSGNTAAIDLLLKRRDKEERWGMLLEIDKSVAKLRGEDDKVQRLAKQLDELRKQNKGLQERLKQLEDAGGK